MSSDLERHFETVWRQLGGPELEPEYRFHGKRKWRFDFALPEQKIAIEVEGGIWQNGRHNRAAGYTKDCEKYNAAALAGWRVFRFTSPMVKRSPAQNLRPVIALIAKLRARVAS